MTSGIFSQPMKIDGICRPYGAINLFGLCFYKDVTPTAFGICAPALIEYDALQKMN